MVWEFLEENVTLETVDKSDSTRFHPAKVATVSLVPVSFMQRRIEGSCTIGKAYRS
jgi:hypothetical protein